jgi:hypothetical protein
MRSIKSNDKVRRILKISFFLSLLLPLISAFLASFGFRLFQGASISLTWLGNALTFSGISWFGLPVMKFVRLKGFAGRVVSSFIVPSAVGVLVVFALSFILLAPLQAVAYFFYRFHGGEAGLLLLALLTISFFYVLGILRFYFDKRITEKFELEKVDVNLSTLILVALISFVSALTTTQFLHYGDLVNTEIAHGFGKSPLAFLGFLVRSYIDLIPAMGVGTALFLLLWVIEGRVTFIDQKR